jgi:hypothetical protein
MTGGSGVTVPTPGGEKRSDEAMPWPCCEHCGCGTPEGLWPTREGHDDLCAQGCNDGMYG